MAVETIPTAAEVADAGQTNANQKIDFASWLNALRAKLGSKSGQGPQTVASATSIDLDAVVETRDIVISGTATVTGFVGEAGKVFRFRASGAFTLTNNSGIVTNTGGNVTFRAGDTGTLRFTATDTVELLGLTRGAVPQWASVIGSRTVGVTYYAPADRPLALSVSGTIVTAGNVPELTMYPPGGGTVVQRGSSNGNAAYIVSIYAEIPPGWGYKIDGTNTLTVTNWSEK